MIKIVIAKRGVLYTLSDEIMERYLKFKSNALGDSYRVSRIDGIITQTEFSYGSHESFKLLDDLKLKIESSYNDLVRAEFEHGCIVDHVEIKKKHDELSYHLNIGDDFSEDFIARTDGYLIGAVNDYLKESKKGVKYKSDMKRLKIIEIPDDVNYRIETTRLGGKFREVIVNIDNPDEMWS